VVCKKDPEDLERHQRRQNEQQTVVSASFDMFGAFTAAGRRAAVALVLTSTAVHSAYGVPFGLRDIQSGRSHMYECMCHHAAS
jgi:hypothetical protein